MRGKSQRIAKYVIIALVVLLLAFFLYKASRREAFDSNSSKSTLDIENAGAFNSTLQSSKKTVAYFYMPGCGHCEKMSPVFDEVANDKSYPGVKFIKVNATKYPEIAEKYDLSGFPTVLRFNGANTSEKDKKVGASNKSSLQSFCKF
jgi:thiol-disulfide isomerase/thioredoxin